MPDRTNMGIALFTILYMTEELLYIHFALDGSLSFVTAKYQLPINPSQHSMHISNYH